jgi:hypothetical protein
MILFRRFLCGSFLAVVSLAVAAGPNPYRDCGIGAALFPRTAWAAVSSNVIWDLGSTANTSATASPGTCQNPYRSAAIFIRQRYNNLIEETASGKGENLVAVMDILGCGDEVQGDVVKTLRLQVGKDIVAQDYSSLTREEKSIAYFDRLTSTASKICKA